MATIDPPPLIRGGGELPVFDPKNADAADPILAGFDAQLGGSWFADRVWRFDFPRAAMSMRLLPLAAALANLPLSFDRGYPQTSVTIAGETLAMSVDIAASVAVATSGSAEVTATSFVRRATFERWHSDRPQWLVQRGVSTLQGVDSIVVPEVRAGTAVLILLL